MNAIERSIATARWRLTLQTWVSAMGWLLLAGVVLVGVLVLIERLFSIPLSIWLYIAVAAAVLLAAPVIAWLRRPSRDLAAAQIDQRLGLKDRLGTALFARTLPDDPFAQRAVHDAEETAAKLRVGQAFALHLTRPWSWVPVVVAVVAVLAVFLKPMDLLGVAEARQAKQKQQARAEAAKDELAKAIKAVKLTEPGDVKEDEASLELMQQLAELTQRDLTNPQMRRQAAAKLSEVQDKLAQKTEQKEQQLQSLQNAMSRLDPQVAGPADKFADALRRGDFDAASQALKELSEAIDKMPDDQKKQLGQQLDNLAKQLDEAAQQFDQQQAQQQQAMQQTLQQAMQNAGMSQQQAQQQAQQMQQQMQQQNMTQQQVQQTLQQQGMTQQQAQQLAKQLQQMQQKKQGQGQCKQCSGGLSQSLSKMAGACKSGGNGGQFQQAAGQGGSALSQLATMQQSLQQQRMAQSQMSKAMQQLGQQSMNQSLSQQWKQSQSNNPGVGPGIGTADGGNPFGFQRNIQGYRTEAQGDIGQGQGRIIASWLNRGDSVKGPPTVAFDKAVNEARSEAEKAVTEDRVPRWYHETIRRYFNQMPRTPQEIGQPASPPEAPPAAPSAVPPNAPK